MFMAEKDIDIPKAQAILDEDHYDLVKIKNRILDYLAVKGVDVLLLDDPDCKAVMREFQERYPQVWSEDIGGR